MRYLLILAVLLLSCGSEDYEVPPAKIIVLEAPPPAESEETGWPGLDRQDAPKTSPPETTRFFASGTIVPWREDLIESSGIVSMQYRGGFFDLTLEKRIDGSVVTDNGMGVVDDWCVEYPCTSTVHIFPQSWDHIVQFVVVGELE